MGHNDFNNNASITDKPDGKKPKKKEYYWRGTLNSNFSSICLLQLLLQFLEEASLRVELHACDLQFYRS